MPRLLIGKVVGPQGPQGEKGDPGEQGPQGVQGPQGENGLTVSVNGVVHDSSGNIKLTPENIGAATAEQFNDLSEQDEALEKQIEGLSGDTINLGFGKETPRTTLTDANDLPQGYTMGQNLAHAPIGGWLYYETRRNVPVNSGGYQRAYNDYQKREWVRYFNSGKWDDIWTPVSPAKYLNISELGLTDTDFSPTDLGGNILKILNNMKQGLTFEMFIGASLVNMVQALKNASAISVGEGILTITKSANTAIPNSVEYMPNSNGTQNIVEKGFYDNVWSGFRVQSGVAYINSGTHTLADYKSQGIYCFAQPVTITDIPTGVNGWLVVIPNTAVNPSVVKQIWYRWGTTNSNSFMTFERTVTPTIIGDWTEYATTRRIEISFPFDAGFVRYSNSQMSRVLKTGDNRVEVYVAVKKTDGKAFAKGSTKIGTLPTGYRPKETVHVGGLVASTGGTCGFYILPSGAVHIDMGQLTTGMGGFCILVYSLD